MWPLSGHQVLKGVKLRMQKLEVPVNRSISDKAGCLLNSMSKCRKSTNKGLHFSLTTQLVSLIQLSIRQNKSVYLEIQHLKSDI